MSKLLNRPLKAFAIYSLLVLGCSIPVYYLIVDYIWRHELDEYNKIVSRRIESGLNKLELNDAEWSKTISLWNQTQPGTTLEKASIIKPDSIYDVTRRYTGNSDEELERYRGLSSYIRVKGKPYHLNVEINVEETHETVLAIAAVTFVFFIILLAGLVILNQKISIKVWKPFHTTLEKLKSFDLNSDKNIDFEKSGIEEFEELNGVLRQLVEKNINVFRQQKEFTENASHELQTPLAVLKSKIDLLIQNENLTQEQSELVESLNIPISRVSRINKNLLLLAKIENRQFSEDENIDISEMLNQNIGFLEEHLTAKNNVVYTQILQNIFLTANRSLVEILIVNLLLNAIRHNPENGVIRIGLTENILTISNTGDIPLDSEMLFKRFITSSKNTPSSGLGLAIVKEICGKYGWQIKYFFADNFHHFSIRF